MQRRQSCPRRKMDLSGRPRFFLADGAVAVVQEFTRAVGPGEGQGEQAHQLGEALGVGEMGVFQVEVPAFQAAELGFRLASGRRRHRSLHSFALEPPVKVGRNDPCPCGSGLQ
jgi:hypothetical protein